MNTRKPTKTCLAIMVLVLAITCVAGAVPVGTVDIEHTGYGAGGLLRVWGGGLFGSYVRGGVYILDKTGDTGQGDLWPNSPVESFCIELSQWAPQNPYEYDVVMPEEAQRPTYFLGGPIGPDKAEYISELWDRFFDPDWIGAGPKADLRALVHGCKQDFIVKIHMPEPATIIFPGMGVLGMLCSKTG
jgi:hypothetical protein